MSVFQIAKAPLRGRFAARLPGFVALMKPRVMSLAVFTAFVGLAIAPGHLDPVLAFVAIWRHRRRRWRGRCSQYVV